MDDEPETLGIENHLYFGLAKAQNGGDLQLMRTHSEIAIKLAQQKIKYGFGSNGNERIKSFNYDDLYEALSLMKTIYEKYKSDVIGFGATYELTDPFTGVEFSITQEHRGERIFDRSSDFNSMLADALRHDATIEITSYKRNTNPKNIQISKQEVEADILKYYNLLNVLDTFDTSTTDESWGREIKLDTEKAASFFSGIKHKQQIDESCAEALKRLVSFEPKIRGFLSKPRFYNQMIDSNQDYQILTFDLIGLNTLNRKDILSKAKQILKIYAQDDFQPGSKLSPGAQNNIDKILKKLLRSIDVNLHQYNEIILNIAESKFGRGKVLGYLGGDETYIAVPVNRDSGRGETVKINSLVADIGKAVSEKFIDQINFRVAYTPFSEIGVSSHEEAISRLSSALSDLNNGLHQAKNDEIKNPGKEKPLITVPNNFPEHRMPTKYQPIKFPSQRTFTHDWLKKVLNHEFDNPITTQYFAIKLFDYYTEKARYQGLETNGSGGIDEIKAFETLYNQIASLRPLPEAKSNSAYLSVKLAGRERKRLNNEITEFYTDLVLFELEQKARELLNNGSSLSRKFNPQIIGQRSGDSSILFYGTK
ncbi:MAG: hypothetical protein KKF44_03085 [Nanoarchaeota archaeon]|nr:hypothetical protein [Nanoarchaeota archaeon]